MGSARKEGGRQEKGKDGEREEGRRKPRIVEAKLALKVARLHVNTSPGIYEPWDLSNSLKSLKLFSQ